MPQSDPLTVYRAIGQDRYVSASELPTEAGAFGRRAWEVYDRFFGRFTGAHLDPGFGRFRRPGLRFGSPVFPAGAAVVVVGAGRSLEPQLAALNANRRRVLVVTGPEGARRLHAEGIAADLVILEPPPGANLPDAGEAGPLPATGAACLIDPAAPVRPGEDAATVRWLARALPTWGVWPATAAAMAISGGAGRVALLGVADDPDVWRADPARTDALLAVLASHGQCECLEIGSATTRGGWWPVSWTNLVPADPSSPPVLGWRDDGPAEILREYAFADLQRLAPLLPDALRGLELGRRARAGAPVSSRDLMRTIEVMLAWGSDASLRWTLQRALGLSFLPRLWRTGVSMGTPDRLWRPIVLALTELVGQADRFESRLTTLAQATARASTSGPGLRRSGPRSGAGSLDPTRVSLIVPVLAEAPHLSETVASLMAQTYANVELVIVHDAGRSAACEPMKALGRTNVRVLQCDGSLADALNLAIASSSGGFIGHHDPDGLSHRQRVSRQLAYLKVHPEVGVLATATGFVDQEGRPVPSPAGSPEEEAEIWTPQAIGERLLIARCFEHGSVLARRPVIEAAGGYRARLAPPTDHDLWLRLLPTARFAKLPTRLYRRLAPAGASVALSPA